VFDTVAIAALSHCPVYLNRNVACRAFIELQNRIKNHVNDFKAG
jgi:hypothetical protein